MSLEIPNINGESPKTTPVDADVMLIEDSASTPAFLKKKVAMSDLKTYMAGAKIEQRLIVGPSGNFTDLQAAITWLAIGGNMTGPTEIVMDGGDFPITNTITISLPHYLSIRGLYYLACNFYADTGLTNKPMFSLATDVFFERCTFDGSTLGSYGTLTTENAINITGNAKYLEFKDFEMINFYDGINLTGASDIFVFDYYIEDILGVGIRVNSTGATSIDCEVGSFINCSKGVYLEKSSAGMFQILSNVFENQGGQIAIDYDPNNYIYTDGPTIMSNSWDNTGTFLNGFDFSLASGRDANIYSVSNAGYEDKIPHSKINIINNVTGIIASTQGAYYKLPFINGNSYNCKIKLVNNIAITSVTGNGATVTVTSTSPHNLKTGDYVTMLGWTGGTGTWDTVLAIITRTGANTFTYAQTGNGTATGGVCTINNNRMTYQSANGTDMMFWISGSIIDSQQNENIDIALRKEIAVSTIVGTNTTTQTVTTVSNHGLRTADFVSLTNWSGGTGTWNATSQIVVTGPTTFTYTTGGNCNGSPTAGTGNLGLILAPTTVRMGTQNVPVNFSFNVYTTDVKQNDYFGLHVNNTSSAGRTMTLSDVSWLARAL